MSLVWFLLMIGPLVFFHELGHFVAARYFGVRCEQFAIGVGPVVASITRAGTEFSIRALPLGGYVRMLGASPEDVTEDDGSKDALTDKPVWQRMVIYLAGPAANIVLAVPLLWLFFVSKGELAGAEVGTVLDGTPAAAAGFTPGDRIVAIDGDPVRYFDDIVAAVASSGGRQLTFEIERDGQRVSLAATPEAVAQGRAPGFQLGLVWSRYASIIDVDSAGPAFAAGLRTFDRVVSVDGQPVDAWIDLRDAVHAAAATTVRLGLRRPIRVEGTFASAFVEEWVEVVVPVAAFDSVRAAEATVFDVEPGSPAAMAGLRRGDRVLAADGRPVTSLEILDQRLENAGGVAHALRIQRDGEELDVSLTPLTLEVTGDMRSLTEQTFVGLITAPDDRVPFDLVRVPPGRRVLRATSAAFLETLGLIASIAGGLFMMVTGAVDSSNLGGPMMIAEVASRAGAQGIMTFTRFMALISVNLAVLNLAPIPGLDGGHLLLLTAEGIRREPLSMRARNLAAYVGLVCLVLLMLFAFKNDIERYWADIALWVNG
ncbi:MAG: RIP metalloprotease RseP [Myxococcales bacterium]|nr:RIP metalloprotease RseP [Myxococcales bacterium]MCB9520086.1 RIP metalloprotease RseP [Myxococcales bacterium]MCB9531812.1 RIP metalloprotease RseP [Myxococcales bacterium]